METVHFTISILGNVHEGKCTYFGELKIKSGAFRNEIMKKA